MATVDNLFTGDPSLFGGLSNEDELARACPPEFKKDNPWSSYAMNIFFGGAKISNWQYKSDNPEEQQRQRVCLRALLSTFGLRHEDKEAVAGWMLSEMLTQVPEYLPPSQES